MNAAEIRVSTRLVEHVKKLLTQYKLHPSQCGSTWKSTNTGALTDLGELVVLRDIGRV